MNWHENKVKCSLHSKVIFVIFQGQHLGTTEATEAFFAMTKLFQSKDVSPIHS